ncbi:MAG: biotin--[acetyl-CoA-carboxylase] ligase [Sneathiella sp.]
MSKTRGGVSLPPFFTLSAFETIDSTNIHARKLGDEGALEGQLIWSLRQEQGVGRRGRDWSSPEGNLYCSVLLRPGCSASEGAKLSFLVAAAMRRAIAPHLPAPDGLSLKWPNDLLINQKKLVGILLESKSNAEGILDWLVIGTGVNVASFPKQTNGLSATSLRAEGGRMSLETLLEDYAFNLLALYEQWKNEGFEPIRQEWLAHAHGLQKKITVRLPHEEFSGIFKDIDPSGALVLRQEDGTTRLVTAGEVFF